MVKNLLAESDGAHTKAVAIRQRRQSTVKNSPATSDGTKKMQQGKSKGWTKEPINGQELTGGFRWGKK